jgi:hypothetical protein
VHTVRDGVRKKVMKTYHVTEEAGDSGEYILGARQTGSHACYMIYGVLKPGEMKRELKPGNGHEEIVLAVTGDLQCIGAFSGILKEGHALHLRGENSVFVRNEGTAKAVYVVSGGHSAHGHN